MCRNQKHVLGFFFFFFFFLNMHSVGTGVHSLHLYIYIYIRLGTFSSFLLFVKFHMIITYYQCGDQVGFLIFLGHLVPIIRMKLRSGTPPSYMIFFFFFLGEPMCLLKLLSFMVYLDREEIEQSLSKISLMEYDYYYYYYFSLMEYNKKRNYRVMALPQQCLQ